MSANLNGVGKKWFLNEGVKNRVLENGVKALMMCQKPGQLVTQKDDWHALRNLDALEPIITAMRSQNLLKTPYMEELEKQVVTLALLAEGKDINAESFAEIQLRLEMEIHIACSSIKKVLSHLRRKYLLPHVPRDRVAFVLLFVVALYL